MTEVARFAHLISVRDLMSSPMQTSATEALTVIKTKEKVVIFSPEVQIPKPSQIVLCSGNARKLERLRHALASTGFPVKAIPPDYEEPNVDTLTAAKSKVASTIDKVHSSEIVLSSQSSQHQDRSLYIGVDVLNHFLEKSESGFQLTHKGQPHTLDKVYQNLVALYETLNDLGKQHFPYTVATTTLITNRQLGVDGGWHSTVNDEVWLSIPELGNLVEYRFYEYIMRVEQAGYDVTKLSAGIELDTLKEMGVTDFEYTGNPYNKATRLALGHPDTSLLNKVLTEHVDTLVKS